MDKSAAINYLEKKQAMLEASNIMENALKTIADIFKNIQVDFSSLVDNNNRLELLVKELNERKNECTLCMKKIIRKKQLSHNSQIESEKKDEDFVGICDNGETLGVIDSTQIEKRMLTKPKCRLKDKWSNPHINNNNTNDLSLPIGTQSKNKKQSCIAKVSTEYVISSGNKILLCCTDIAQSVSGKLNEEISENRMNDKELEPEYSDIDATMFEQPFSQDQSSEEKSPATGDTGEIGNLNDNVNTTSPARSFLDDVVEVSPKKNILRRKNWLRHIRPTVKSYVNESNSDLSEISNADNNEKERSTQISLKYITAKEKEKERNNNKARVETKVRTPTYKTNIFSPQIRKRDKSPARKNESTFLSVPLTKLTASNIATKSNLQTSMKGINNNLPVMEVSVQSQLRKCTSDETYFVADEMNCSTLELSPKKNYNKGKEKIVNNAKRKFSEIAITSDTEKNAYPKSTEVELDIGDISDWDTDISCDKWPSTPQKRVLVDSFDEMPVKKEVAQKFATKGPVVRNKAEREKLRGWDCKNCAKYYNNIGLSEKELAERKNQCSRHRSKFNEQYFTPPGLWDIRFPNTQAFSQD